MRYENSNQLMTMTFHENGIHCMGFPEAEWRSKWETTLSGGNGILVTFYGNGHKQSESAYGRGLWHGSSLTWFEGGQIKRRLNTKMECSMAVLRLFSQRSEDEGDLLSQWFA